MIVKVNPENFIQVAFAGQIDMDIKMSSACQGGGGCYQCKCSPRRESLGSEQDK
jgi:Na+-transporting NADH:ubiquinone oxidoreductase subunit NqrF